MECGASRRLGGDSPNKMTKHRLEILWESDAMKQDDLKLLVERVAVDFPFKVVGHNYNQCGDDWQPVILEGDLDTD